MTRVGLLGAGGMGSVHAAQYAKMTDVELRFFDPRPDQAERFQSRFHAEPCRSEDDLIDWADVVDVCTPTDTHHGLGRKAIAAGRALLMEKPLCRTLGECEGLMAAAEKAGVPAMPAQVVRYFPEYAAAKRMVESGAVGDVAAVRLRRGGGAPSGVDGWFMDHARSGGVFFDLAIHDFDWIRWALADVATVYAKSLRANVGHGPDYGLATLTLENGAVAHVEATWMDPCGFRTVFEVCGSGGMILHDSRLTPSVRVHREGGSVTESPLAPQDDPYYREIRAFLEAVRNKERPPVTLEDGFAACAVALAALESAQTGLPVRPARP